MTTFQAEPWSKVRSEVIQCWPEHYFEAYNDDDYDPDIEKYDALATMNVLLVVTARRDSQLIGYAVAFIQAHLHQRGVLWGVFDSYWLRRDTRGPRLFPRLIQATEGIMKGLGVRRILALEFSKGRMFSYLGYQAAERVYVKEL